MYSVECSPVVGSGRSCTRAEVTSYHRRVPFVRVGVASSLLAALLVTSLVAPVRAQEAPVAGTDVPSSIPRVAVVLLPRGAASSDMTDSLTELLISAIAGRGPTEIVGKEEFQAALGRDDAGTLACIESDACLGRMGRELRVRELVAGTLHRDAPTADQPERFRFELYRLDVESGSARGRVAREVDGGLSALLSALTASVDELYVEHVEPGAVVVQTTPRDATLTLDDTVLEPGADGAFRRGFLVPGMHRLVARAAGRQGIARDITIEPGTTLMLSLELAPSVESLDVTAPTIVAAGTGAGVLVLASVFGTLSLDRPNEMTQGTLDMRQTHAYFDARANEALAANVLFAVGGACLVVALVSLLVDLTAGGEEDLVARALRGEVAWW